MSDVKSWPLPTHRSGATRLRTVRQARSGVERVACHHPCELLDAGGRRYGTVWNLSILGAYVVIEGPLPPVDTQVQLSFAFRAATPPINVQACVAWRNPSSSRFAGQGAVCPSQPPGCGVEFLALSADDRERIAGRIREARKVQG